MELKMDEKCLGKTPGYVRYSGYDTPEEEAEYLPTLGPVWCDGDPISAEDYAAAEAEVRELLKREKMK
jgi:hypothetical protein